MSDDLSLDDILVMYVQESKEHLESIENDLLALEREGVDSDDESINKMFRAAHSIKGGSGFWGLDTIKNLSHKTENVLDLIRKRRMDPTPEVVSIILRAFDRLGELLVDPQNSNSMDIAAEVAALENLTASHLPEGEKKSVSRMVEVRNPDVPVVFAITEFDLRQARQNGNHLYILEFDLLKDVHRRGKTPLDFLGALNEQGSIIDIIYDLAVMGDLESDQLFSRFPVFVLFKSVVEPDLMGTLVGLEARYVHPVSEEDEGREAAPAVPGKTVPPVKEPVAAPAAPDPPKETGQASRAPARPVSVQADSLRVQVHVLDQLINRAGELVLARNQLLQSFARWDKAALKAACQRIDVVTSELQESIMLTRMQPINNIFSKFPRMVRDLCQQVGKKIDLAIEGKEVEVDKTIIEGLGDPLTHLVRNSVDHGIEPPEVRKKNGKPETGVIRLKAFHESGQIIIEITDDGKGMDGDTIAAKALEKGLISAEYLQSLASEKEKLNLIMLPGFSMAEKVTDISGRGVGMDVVKTNLDKMGGHLEFDARPGQGVTVRVKLPLTLAIIPSLLVSSSDERFALPQIHVGELLRIPAAEVREKITKVSGADVLMLRGELIPLLQLNNLLDLRRIYFDPGTAEFRPDRRAQLGDERLLRRNGAGGGGTGEEEQPEAAALPEDRRNHPRSDVNIVVLQAGSLRYALVVDNVHDTVEIVVKPLGRHLNQCAFYAGATIMGDGRVALILDVAGLATLASLREIADTSQARKLAAEQEKKAAAEVRQSLLLFHNGPGEYCAVPLQQVQRVEQIRVEAIEVRSNQKVIRYRDGILPVFALEEVAAVEKIARCEALVVIIFAVAGREFGLLAVPPLGVIEERIAIDDKTLRQPGIAGSAIIHNRTTVIVDIIEFIRAINPSWIEQAKDEKALPPGGAGKGTILLVEDSTFFRTQVKRFVEEEGYTVREAADGQAAWELLTESPAAVGMVVTDIEMPRMNGFELISRMKGDERLARLPVIVLTTLAEEEDVVRGSELGVAAYHIKLDRENLVRNITDIFKKSQGDTK